MTKAPPSAATRLILALARTRYSWRKELAALLCAGSLSSGPLKTLIPETWQEHSNRCGAKRLFVEVAAESPDYPRRVLRGLRLRLTLWPESFLPAPLRRRVERRRSIRLRRARLVAARR